MMNIDERDFRRVDLNLLVTFEVLMRERHVTHTAHALGISQAAASAALARLRRLFADELFVRTKDGMAPTPKAQEIAPRIRWALRELSGVLFEEAAFDPADSDRVFVLAMSDDVEAHLLPRVLQHLQAEQLGVSVLVRQSNRYTVESLLAEGSVDLAIGALPGLPASFHREELFTSGYACLYDGHRLGLGTPLSLQDYLTLPHLLVSYDGRRGIVDELLEARRLRRRIIGSTTHFAGALTPLRTADVVVTLPHHAAAAFAAATALTLSEPPIPTPRFSVSMTWTPQRENDPAQQWLRGVVRACLATVSQETPLQR
ncbi:LysR substrate-binding domain-containing protein [Kocuria rosea]|uniref:LysR substrate-binding domain-containing protein n=1 Tax=Kocuria rosea TaxID=1275 RepID=UPI002041B950|nr:LysR substrate-binding domain-containing protein [Kocuria rosea]